jgi:hypothetical protein
MGECTGTLPFWYRAGLTPRRSSNAATIGLSSSKNRMCAAILCMAGQAFSCSLTAAMQQTTFTPDIIPFIHAA